MSCDKVLQDSVNSSFEEIAEQRGTIKNYRSTKRGVKTPSPIRSYNPRDITLLVSRDTAEYIDKILTDMIQEFPKKYKFKEPKSEIPVNNKLNRQQRRAKKVKNNG